MSDTLLSDEALRALNARLRTGASPRDPALGARGVRPRALARRLRVPGRGDLRDAHGDVGSGPTCRCCSSRPGSTSPRRSRSRSSSTERLGPERRRPRRRAHAGHAGGGVRSPPVRARSGRCAARSTRWSRCSRRCAACEAWVTAFRRDSSPTRADAPIVDQYELEPGRWIVKVNPVANWTRRDTWAYLKEHELPAQPALRPRLRLDRLRAVHAVSLPGEHERAGRWAGQRSGSAASRNAAPDPRRPRAPRSPARPRPRGPRARGRSPGGGDRPASRRRPGPGTASSASISTCRASCT